MRCDIELDFDLVDDICLACENGAITPADIQVARANKLGPLLKLIHISPRLGGHELGRTWLETENFSRLLSRLSPIATWFDGDFHEGITSVSRLQNNGLAWTNFVHKFRAGASLAGFAAVHSAKLAAAIGEIYSNVIDHSEAVHSGYVAYRATPGRFEFVIGDSGIGVLQSLRRNPLYSNLPDSGAALELALKQGVSRYSDGDHGFGFVPLFTGLANVSREIRFRSGHHARMIDREINGRINSRTRELAECPGFFCSVLCDLQ